MLCCEKINKSDNEALMYLTLYDKNKIAIVSIKGIFVEKFSLKIGI